MTECHVMPKYCTLLRHLKYDVTVDINYVQLRRTCGILMVLYMDQENQQNKLLLALCYKCFGVITKAALKWQQPLRKSEVTQFTVCFVPFCSLHRAFEMIRQKVRHFVLIVSQMSVIYISFCTYACTYGGACVIKSNFFVVH